MAVDKNAAVAMRQQGATLEEIAQALGTNHKYISQLLQRCGFTPRKRICNAYYTVYLAATDEIVATGTARECAEQLGMANVMSFHSIASHTRAGQRSKYVFYVDKEDDEE